MKRPFNPRVEIVHDCVHICNAFIQTLRLNKRYKSRYWDYPVMAASHDAASVMKRAKYSRRSPDDYQ